MTSPLVLPRQEPAIESAIYQAGLVGRSYLRVSPALRFAANVP